MKKLFATVAVVALGAMACSKKDTGPNNSATIIGKWQFVSAHSKFKYTDPRIGNTDTTILGHAGDFINFGSNGTASSHVWDASSSSFNDATSSYMVSGNLLILDTDTATIQTLTSSNLSLYVKNVYTIATIETWESFKR